MILPFLLLLPWVPLQEEKPLLTQDELLELVREAMPAVERATGRKFVEPVWVRLSTPADVRRAMIDELIPQMKILAPEADDAQARTLAERSAALYGEILVAKYAWKRGVIHVLPETMRKIARALRRPALLERKAIRVIVVHELVHALDHQEFRLFDAIEQARSSDRLEILNALMEGHAQHVTRKVLAGLGDLESFEAYEATILAGPPGLEEAERYLATLLTASLRLAYVDGRAFFDALEKSGRATYVEDVFRKPPASKNVLLKPERYYGGGPEAPDFDPTPAFDAIAKDFGPEWIRRTQELDNAALRAAFGNFVEAAKVTAALNDVLEGRACVFAPKAAPQSRIVVVAVVACRGAEAARRMFDLSVELSKAKDAKLTEGRLRITKSDYGSLPLASGAAPAIIRKTMMFQEQEIPIVTVLGVAGELEYELVFSNEEVDDARLKSTVERLLEALRKR